MKANNGLLHMHTTTKNSGSNRPMAHLLGSKTPFLKHTQPIRVVLCGGMTDTCEESGGQGTRGGRRGGGVMFLRSSIP